MSPLAGSGLPALGRTTIGRDEGMDWVVDVGLGLDYDSLRLGGTGFMPVLASGARLPASSPVLVLASRGSARHG
jgi:hypothetical protein